jgi:hypothetical protein
MEASNKIFELLKDLLEQLPSFLTIIACLVFAIVRWKRSPTVSQVVLIGLVLLFLHLIVFSIVYTWVPDLFIRAAVAADQPALTRNVYLVLGLITNVSFGLALAVLLTAIFIQRPATNHQ